MNIHCHRYFLSFSHFHFRPTSRYICALHSACWYKNPNNHNPYSSEYLRTQLKSLYSGDYDWRDVETLPTHRATVTSLFTHLNTAHSTQWKLTQKNVAFMLFSPLLWCNRSGHVIYMRCAQDLLQNSIRSCVVYFIKTSEQIVFQKEAFA